MSVHASLARLRASTSSTTLRPPPLPQPRRDMAGLALNGLETLSTIDTTLPTLASSLLLLPPYPDRATLPPEEAQLVSAAVLSAAAHLAPVFPMRPAQKLVSWLVHGLRVPQLGAEREVDALMLAALPFHETPQFVQLVASMLREGKWHKWEWLRPVVKQKKPPSLDFLVRDCPQLVLRLAVAAVVEAVGDGINTLAGASLLANLLIRRLGSSGSIEKRALFLAVVEAIDKTVNLKVNDKSRSDLLCALMSAVAAAVPSGLENDIAEAAAQAVAGVIKMAKTGSPVSDTAVACLAMLVSKAKVSAVEKGVSRSLLRRGAMPDVLSCLGDEELARSTYAAVVMGIVSKPSVRMLGLLQKAFASENVSLLCEQTVHKVLLRLFAACADAEIEEESVTTEKRQAMLEAFAGVVASLSRGRFAPGVDIALREHLASRRKADKRKYSFVDEGIEKALSGTAYSVGKDAAKKSSLPKGGTILAMMSHPEHSVVKTALAKLVDSNYSWIEQEASVTESIVGRCSILLKGDSDAHVAADAALCLLQAKSEALPEHVLPSILSRLRSAYNLLRKKKKRKPSRISGLIALCNALLTGCERDTGTDPVKVQAMLIGLIRDGVFSNNSVVSHDEETFKRLATLLSQETEIRCLDSAELGDGQLREVVEAALRSKIASRTYKFDALVESMSEWDPSWALELLAFCVHQGDKKALKKFAEFRAAGVVESLVRLYEDHESIRAKILEEAVNAIGPIHDALGSQFSQSRVVDRIWNLAARLENEKIAQQVLAKVHGYCGFVKVKNMLQSASAVTSVSGGRIQFYSLQWFLISCESDSSNEVNQEAMLCLFGALYGNDNQARDKVLALCAAKAAVHNSTLPKSPLISFYCAIANYHASVAIPLTSESTLEQLDNFLSGALLNYRSRLGFIAPLAALEGLEEKSAVIRLASNKIVDQEYDPLQRLYFLRALEGYSGYEETEVLSLFRMEINLLSKLLGDTDRSSVTCESLVRVAQILGTMKTHSLSREVIIDAAEETASLLQALDKKRPLLSGEVNLAVIAGFSQLFSICNCRELDITQDLLRHMLSFSTRASTAGSVARQTLDSTVLNDKLNNLLPFLQRLGTKERAPDAMDVQVDDGVRPSTLDQEAGMGAVDTIKRWLLTDKMIDRPFKFDVTSVLSSLWSFVRAVTSESSLMRNAGDRNEYQLYNVLDLIEQILHRERERNMQDTAVDLDALMKAVFYPHVSHEGNESALMRSVRCQALQVAMVLAPRCGNELASRLCDVLSAQMEDVSFSKQLKSVHRLAAVLLKSGCDPRVVCNFLVRAAYKKIGNTVASEEDRELIVSCCRLMPDMEEALLCCLQQICKESADYLEVKSIARECSRLLLGAEQSLIMDLSVIARVGSDIRCELALVHVVGPLFRKKLTEAVQSATSDASVIEGISNLLKSLWVLNRNIADRPVTALVSFLPLRAISLCLGNIISTENVAIRIRAVKTLSGRMLDDASLLYGWHENDQKLPDYVDLKSSQTAFVEELGSILSAVISEFGDKDHVKINELGAELKLCSLSCIQNIADRIGSSAPQVLLQLSTTPLQVLRASSKFLDKPEEIVNGQWQSDVAVAMDCLSSMVTVIGKRAVTFIPEVVSTAADILQAVFGKETRNATSRIQKDLRVSVTEAAMRMCTTVLDRTPKFFGRLTLNRIASLAVSVEREDINALLVEAMTKVPANVSVGALVYVTANFAKFSATLTGVSTLLRGMSALTGVISKVELKPQKDRLTLALLSCIEYGRLGNTSPASVQENEMDTQSAARKCSTVELFNELVAIRGPEGFLSSCKKVDNGCADNFTQMVLRLSESDFKIIFNRVVQWLEGGRVMGGADRSNAIDMPQYLSRAVPILRISLKLMHVLRAIFVPYFLQLLDLVLEVLSSTSSKSSLDATVELDADERKDLKSKKRKREKWEGSGEDAVRQVSSQLHRELYGLALESLTLLLREDLTGNILTPTLVTKIQTSLVVACGNGGKSEAVRKAVNALGTRIVAVGNMKESKEECREQLIAMSRAILSLAGGTDAVVREASMYYCKCLASTIGEEYLVTLPEAMPVLAELIDDEKDAVRRETSSFVKVMEALSGESIMEDMKS